MTKHLTILFALFICCSLGLVAQTTTIRGILTDEQKTPLAGLKVILVELNQSVLTDASGTFEFKNIPYGVYSIETRDELFDYSLAGIKAEQPVTDITSQPFAKRARPLAEQEEIPTVSLSDDDLKESSSQNVASVLNSSRDVFVSATTFNFSVARFRLRGYDDENFTTLMNDVPMTDLTTGRTMYNTWSGLNDVMRGRETTLGLAPASYSFGSIGGVYNIDSRASHQRKQIQVSYSAANRIYENRLMATYGSGILKGGWSFALSYSRRWSEEGYIPGTFYDGHSYFASVEKIINSKHSLALTVFGAPTKNGRSAAAVKEIYNLAGTHYYNPDWGYQNGKKRNAVIANNNRPVAILTHEWTISEKSSLESAVSFVFGKSKLSGLDWYNATDPRPDYYRKLPSYALSSTNSGTLYGETYDLFKSDVNVRQINWDNLYNVNYHADTSAYVVADRVTDMKLLNLNTIYTRTISDRTVFYAGATYQSQVSEYYKELNDLLGGDYFVDLNQFADESVAGNIQNNLDNPDRKIHEGDKYGYDYEAHITQVSGWAQGVFKFNKVDLFGALQLSNTSFYRTGKVRNGVYSSNSFGDSNTKNFINYGFKTGVTYKINGRNYLFVNGSRETRAPRFDDAFFSPRTQNGFAFDLKEETVSSMEGGYFLKAPKIKARAIGYIAQFDDQTRTYHYYNDDFRTFVNYTLTGINIRNIGTELAVEAMVFKGLSAYAVAAVGQNFYTDRPLATITQDNITEVVTTNEIVYATNLHVGGSPENAYSVGLNYRSSNFWFLNLDVNYFDNTYISFNPARRTAAAVDQIDGGSDQRNEILSQEKVSGEYTVNISGGWSWKINNKMKSLKKNTFLVLNFGVNNILDNQNLISGGFEQLRFDFIDQNVKKFDTKYYYAPGINFFVNLTLRMN